MRRGRCAVSRLRPLGRTPGTRPRSDTVRFKGSLLDSLLHFTSPQRLAMRAVSADFGPCQQNVEAEMAFDLAAQTLQRLAEKFFYFAAAQADHVSVFLLHAGLVIMLVPTVMH